MHLKASLLALCVACLSSHAARGQDLVSVAPQNARVEYENEQVRVVRLRVPPHGSLPTHDRPARVVVSLTANNAQLTRADGTTSVTRTEAGTVAWSEPTVRSVVNLSDAPLENIVIELKTADGPAKPVAAAPDPSSEGYLSEPFHRWVFENQYVRVFDVRIPAGATTQYHRHAHNSVAVFVSGGQVSSQPQGKPWGQKEKIEAGAVDFGDDAVKPVVHRVHNEGDAEYHVILVQLLRPLTFR